MKTRRVPALFAFLALSFAQGASAGVLEVAVPDGPYTTIQSAVDAASDGDFVLIKNGTHAGFTLDGKAVSVAIDIGSTSTIQGSVVVKNLPAGKSLALTRLRVTGTGFNGPVIGSAVRLEDCAGSVRVEGCILNGANGASLTGCSVVGDASAGAALRIVRCADVGVGISTLRGGFANNLYEPSQCATGPTQGGSGGCGVQIEDANVALYDCTLIAGDGGGSYLLGGAGGDALRVVDTSPSSMASGVFVSHCVLDGTSTGGSAWPAVIGAAPGTGGSAIAVKGICAVRTLDCSLLAGVSGCSSLGPCLVPAALVVAVDGGSVEDIVGVASVMATQRILRERQPVVLTIVGAPQQSVLLLLSSSMNQAFSGPLHGVLLLGSPFLGPFVLGSTSGSGNAEFHLGSFDLPVGIDYVPIQIQALVASATQGTLTGSANIALLKATL